MSQSVVENVPKANVESVHSSRVNSTVNSAGRKSAHNQSVNSAKGISNVPKLVVRKDQG